MTSANAFLPITPTPYVTHSKIPRFTQWRRIALQCILPRKFFCFVLFFRKNAIAGKPSFSNSSLGFCPTYVKLVTYTLKLDLI